MLSNLLHETVTHLVLAGSALLLAVLLGAPIAIATAKTRLVRSLTLGGVGVARSLPTIAILALLLPWLGVGRIPAIVALALLALPPIVVSIDAGLRALPAAASEIADSLGIAPRTRFLRLEIPVAVPFALAGIRTASVECIASATLATFVGGGGLGDSIVRGLQTGNDTLLVAASALVAALAFGGDALLGLALRATEGGA
ncbi:MAG TPA: ABC transporter permease subunit [Candidatus Dormibacteraeota bacterium]|nr:ABC transporter permease subunit [Candidatus Dormibacteraeota bacterium]